MFLTPKSDVMFNSTSHISHDLYNALIFCPPESTLLSAFQNPPRVLIFLGNETNLMSNRVAKLVVYKLKVKLN